jgi:TldD protein
MAMLSNELLEGLLKRTLSAGGDYADVFAEWKKPTYIQLEEGRIEKTVSGIEQGVGIRLVFGGRTAFAFSNDLSSQTLLEVAGTLSRAAAGGNEVGEMDLRRLNPAAHFEIKLPPESVPMKRKVDLARAADGAARGAGAGIRQVKVIYRDSVQRVQVATSEGVMAEDERVHTVCIVQVVVSEEGVIQTGYETAGGFAGFELFEDNSVEEMARKAAGRALMMLRAGRAPGGRMPVVISSEAGGTMIHEAIGHGLEADLAGQGLSWYSGKMGQQVASRLVSVLDDGTLKGKRGSFRFDDEGTASQRTVLVRDGMLEGYLYDKLSALKEGVSPTGNGRRESYRHRPIPRMTNTFVAPGGSSPEEVLRSTPGGLFVRKMGGGQVNTVTGDFVFDVQEGYLIDNGTLGRPVRGATLTGNGPEVLRSIDMVASDLGFAIGTCGKDSQGVPVSDAMPTLRIPEMVIGGEV